MKTALIGYSGFVGQSLLHAASFEHLYRSTNIQDIVGQSFELVVCAGAPGQKWLANKDPLADAQSIDSLISCLESIKTERFVLISTVDVFGKPVSVGIGSPRSGLHVRRIRDVRRRKGSYFPTVFKGS